MGFRYKNGLLIDIGFFTFSGLLLVASCAESGGSGSSNNSSNNTTNGICGKGSSSTQASVGYSQRTGADPLIPYQWYLHNEGKAESAAFSFKADGTNHANVLKVHDDLGITGQGITVNVIDTGLELGHKDLTTNQALSFDYLEGDTDPQPIDCMRDHGTSVAGIIGMRKNNAIGGSGVAPGVTLIGHGLITRTKSFSFNEHANALGLSENGSPNNIADIYNQSYGTDKRYIANASDSTVKRETFETGVTSGRQGKGYVYIKSAGNGFNFNYMDTSGKRRTYQCNAGDTSCSNASASDFINSLPETLVVSATNARGVLSSYSTTGSSVWVSAPGGEYGYGDIQTTTQKGRSIWDELFVDLGYPQYLEPAMVTTDISSCEHGNSRVYDLKAPMTNLFEYAHGAPHILNNSCDFTSTFNGTSAAAPLVSGVVALMLEANPELTWRDVKHILATTADKIDRGHTGHSIKDVTVDSGWQQNSKGYWFSNWYGFGQVNAYEAVSAAKGYASKFGVYKNATAANTSNTTIPNNPTHANPTSVTLPLSATGIDFVESVRIQLSVAGGHPFDLTVQLISPSGTISTMLSTGSAYDDRNGYSINDATLLSNTFYGEAANGDWVLRVYDLNNGSKGPFEYTDDTAELKKWNIHIDGHTPTP